MAVDIVKVIKITGTAMSVAGMLLTSWAGGKENTKTLENLVNAHFANK